MANQFYGYNYGGGSGAAANSLYSSRPFADSYFSSDSSLRGSLASKYSSSAGFSDSYSARAPGFSATTSTQSYGPPGVDAGQGGSSGGSIYGGFKRTGPESLYHQTLFGDHSSIGQTEAWYSMNPLAKRLRYESTSHLPIYPQRPGERDCAYYMQTRTCKFGDSCKFDHPIWVPEGGIPDWKEVPPVASEILPERPGEPDCPHFLKTQRCQFGIKCKFNHPKDSIAPPGAHEVSDVPVLPERPSEPQCAFYMKTGKCKFGMTCKFHHPKDVQIQPAGEENDTGIKTFTFGDANSEQLPSTPALFHNNKGLPIRPGAEECPFYLKTGSCKYGTTCRYSHPDLNGISPLLNPSTTHFNIGVAPSAPLLQTYNPRLTSTALGLSPAIYPQRPGEPECDYYMKTGICKFANNCKFHHPIDRSAPMPASKDLLQENVKLTLAGLPRREGAIHCPYYMKTGTCKYGATCRFDHPPPGEVMAMAAGTLQGASSTAIDEAKAKENGETV